MPIYVPNTLYIRYIAYVSYKRHVCDRPEPKIIFISVILDFSEYFVVAVVEMWVLVLTGFRRLLSPCRQVSLAKKRPDLDHFFVLSIIRGEYVSAFQDIVLPQHLLWNLPYLLMVDSKYRKIFGCSHSIHRISQNHVDHKNEYENNIQGPNSCK